MKILLRAGVSFCIVNYMFYAAGCASLILAYGAGMVYHIYMSRELSIIIFDKNGMSSEMTEIYLKELECVKSVKIYADYVLGCEECAVLQPDAAIVDITDNQEFGLEVSSKLSKAKIPVIITSMNTNASVIIKALRCGAVEFLAKPVLKSELHAAIAKLLNANDSEDKEESRIITVFSGKGGSGKTTVGVNLALELARITGKKTALIDMNFCLGEAAAFLNLKTSFNFSSLLENVDNIKPDMLLGMFDRYEDNELYVLSESPSGAFLSAVTFNRAARFFKLLKEIFTYIIIDLPTAADEKVFKTLRLADYILYVTAVNYSALKNTKNCINILAENGVQKDNIKIILNRYIENDELTTEEIESELGMGIYKKIPNNYFTVMSAINKGISVPEENINSNVAESFRELAVMLSDNIMEKSLKNIRGRYEYQSAN